jgi:esterase/lipase superfamily enzyme
LRRNIPHHLDDWGAQGGHDWPFWIHEMREYIGRSF